MHREIEALLQWKRRWMPPSQQLGARLILHMLHYHDELVRDIGASPLRKRGIFAPLKELIAPYEPRDYEVCILFIGHLSRIIDQFNEGYTSSESVLADRDASSYWVVEQELLGRR